MSRPEHDFTTVADEVLRVTDKAVQVQLFHPPAIHWLAKSQLRDPERYAAGQVGVLVTMRRWLANMLAITPGSIAGAN